MTYVRYCADMKKFEQHPMSEVYFNIMQGIGNDTQAPLIIEPKKDHRKAAASLDNFIKIAESSKRRHCVRISETLPKKPRAVKPRILKHLPNSLKKISLKDMTPEELRLHKNEIKRKSLVRRKEAGTFKTLSEEQREIQRQYSRDYYWKNHEVQREKERIRRQNMTEEQKAKIKEAMRTWQEENREHVNAQAREWKRINRAKKRESINNTSPLQKVS